MGHAIPAVLLAKSHDLVECDLFYDGILLIWRQFKALLVRDNQD